MKFGRTLPRRGHAEEHGEGKWGPGEWRMSLPSCNILEDFRGPEYNFRGHLTQNTLARLKLDR